MAVGRSSLSRGSAGFKLPLSNGNIMWYYFARSILLANDANSLQALLESLAELVREEPHVALCKSVVIQFAQERRAECPELWTPPVAAAFGQLLQTMTAAYSSPHDNVAVTKEWTSVLEQVSGDAAFARLHFAGLEKGNTFSTYECIHSSQFFVLNAGVVVAVCEL